MAANIEEVNIVKNAFANVSSDSMLQLPTERAKIAKQSSEYLIKLFEKDEGRVEFTEFCIKWVGNLRENVKACGDILKSSARDKLWKSFFVHRTTQLESIWVEFMQISKVDPKYYEDPLLIQIVCRHVFESIIKIELPSPTIELVSTPNVSIDEKNAVRYAAGYVLRSIRIKLSKVSSTSSTTLVAFIDTLRDESEDHDESEESYIDYTCRWIKKVNRGGLFVVCDQVYETFLAIEIVEQKYLKDVNNPFNQTISVDALVQIIITDDDVQFWWSLVCATLENDLAEVLLDKIVRLWVTLRGFSFASAIVEQYKQCTRKTKK